MGAGDSSRGGRTPSVGVDEPVLRTAGLTKRFGASTAVDGVDFSLRAGELRGLIGPNGAGKTTFFHLIAGLLRPSAGDLWLRRERITDLPAHARARRGIALSLQVESLFPSLSVEENVLGAVNAGGGLSNALGRYDADRTVEAARDVLARVGLGGAADRRVGDLSHGEQKLLEVGLALATDPDLLLLDEPTAGLSSEETGELVDLVADLAEERSVVLIEHDVDVVMGLADRVTVLHDGRVLAEGTPEAIAENEVVQEVYLGRGP